MRDHQPPTEIMKATEARQHFASVINRVARNEARVIVEKSGVPVAGIVSASDMERLERLDAQRAERFRVIDAMRESFKDVPPEELEREAARAIAEVRAEMRAERERAAGR
ncbi:MAG TPA: type II toxin-antitoxin system Phd/YefM family antitoxin [Thermomicrobiales bacterium]|jgi:prevent-host-death family protein|nr:type II toxin-antitoxin system Phd/YefM family antitoxin [Thermomicrobiales bacterium]